MTYLQYVNIASVLLRRVIKEGPLKTKAQQQDDVAFKTVTRVADGKGFVKSMRMRIRRMHAADVSGFGTKIF